MSYLMGMWNWKNNWGKDDLPEDSNCNSHDEEWEKWRREVDRPSLGLVLGALFLMPFMFPYLILKGMSK